MNKIVILSCLWSIALFQSTVNADIHISPERTGGVSTPGSLSIDRSGIETPSFHEGQQTATDQRVLTVIDTSITGWPASVGLLV